MRTVVHGVKEDLIDYEHWIHRRRTKMGLVNMYKEICFVLHKHRHTWEARNCEMYKLTLSFLFVILSGFIILYIQIDQKHNDLKINLRSHALLLALSLWPPLLSLPLTWALGLWQKKKEVIYIKIKFSIRFVTGN